MSRDGAQMSPDIRRYLPTFPQYLRRIRSSTEIGRCLETEPECLRTFANISRHCPNVSREFAPSTEIGRCRETKPGCLQRFANISRHFADVSRHCRSVSGESAMSKDGSGMSVRKCPYSSSGSGNSGGSRKISSSGTCPPAENISSSTAAHLRMIRRSSQPWADWEISCRRAASSVVASRRMSGRRAVGTPKRSKRIPRNGWRRRNATAAGSSGMSGGNMIRQKYMLRTVKRKSRHLR